jgi:hypothetical protein
MWEGGHPPTKGNYPFGPSLQPKLGSGARFAGGLHFTTLAM